MTNIYRPHIDEPREQPGFRAGRARLGRQVGTERLGLSLWELPAGEAAYPYHFHLGEEEVLIVLSGRPSLRAPDGWRELSEGEVASFPVGEGGAHQVLNRTEELVRFLAISTHGAPDLYPDSGKVGAFERKPDGSGLRAMFRSEQTVGYYEGETPPGPGDAV